MNTTVKPYSRVFTVMLLAVLVAAGVGYLVRGPVSAGQALPPQSTLDMVKQTKELRIGYAVYPPYIQKDPQTGVVSGYGIDVAKEIASQMNVKPVFVESSWNTFIPDLESGKFDTFPTVFLTIPRAMQVDFSEPYGYSSSVAALVKKDDTRFVTINDLNKKGVTI